MRTEDKYMLGTVQEICDYFAKDIYKNGDENFVGFDFKVVDKFLGETDHHSLDEIMIYEDAWYGIRYLKEWPFNPDGMVIGGDYWGGSLPAVINIYEDFDMDEISEGLRGLLKNVYTESELKDNTMIIIQTV